MLKKTSTILLIGLFLLQFCFGSDFRLFLFSVVNLKMCIARFTAFFKAWCILMVVGLSGFSFYASTAIMIVCVFVY